MTHQHVIAISRAIGAGGEEVGRMVAKQLGFRYADEEIIVRAAEKAGVDAARVADAETTPALITRILDSLGRTPMAAEGFAAPPIIEETPVAYEGLIEQVLKETASEGNVVIVGHGASISLAGTPGLLRVLVTAPTEARAERLARAQGMDAGKAEKAVKHSDNQRKAYLKRFYSVGEESPDHYDVVLNTDSVTLEGAARAIVAASTG
jgi:cytidylate kinase